MKIRMEKEEQLENFRSLFPLVFNRVREANWKNVEVFLDTVETIKLGTYDVFGEKKPADIHPHLKRCKKGTVMFESLPKLFSHLSPGLPQPKIYVENIDTFEKAAEWGPTCACLNMASKWNPGGGVLTGSRAQEEDLCRRSTLAWSLFRYASPEHQTLLKIKRSGFGEYPLSRYGCVYSPSVAIIKDRNYKYLSTPIETNVISAAAIKDPALKEDGNMISGHRQITAEKIRSVLRCAATKGLRKLVLGAWGCGAYHNPPKQIAEIFRKTLNEEEFRGWFEEICFAIIDDHNARKNNTAGNYKIFHDVFGGKEDIEDENNNQ